MAKVDYQGFIKNKVKSVPSQNLEDYKADLRKRIDMRNGLIGEMQKSNLWKNVVKDMTEQRDYINKNWQTVTDEKKLNQMRGIKMGCDHIIDLETNYSSEVRVAADELTVIENPDAPIKDWEQ